MDNSMVIALASGSFLLGLAAVALLVYMVLRSRRRHSQKTAKTSEPAAPRATAAAPPPPADNHAESANKAPAKGSQHSLFVIFAEPDETTDQRLADWLRDRKARFDPVKKVFHIDGVQPSNPITIANAFPPGDMPDLLQGEVHQPIRGISLLVKPPLRKRRNQQMIAYVEVAKEIGQLFDGNMLDGDRAPASEATYARIIG